MQQHQPACCQDRGTIRPLSPLRPFQCLRMPALVLTCLCAHARVAAPAAKFVRVWERRVKEYEANFARGVEDLKAAHEDARIKYAEELEGKRPTRPKLSRVGVAGLWVCSVGERGGDGGGGKSQRMRRKGQLHPLSCAPCIRH